MWTIAKLLATALLGALLAILAPIEHAFFALRLGFESAPETLSVPVEGVGVKALRDSWGAPRPGGRRHRGIDIFAPRGTPVRSTTRGVIVKTGRNRLGGNVVWVLGPGRQMHYYAHLDRFGEFGAGDVVEARHVIGYVGNTGNARGTPPHLHYGIYSTGREPVNPYMLLTGAAAGSFESRVALH